WEPLRLHHLGLEPGPVSGFGPADDVHVGLDLAHLEDLHVLERLLEGLHQLPEIPDLLLLLGVVPLLLGGHVLEEGCQAHHPDRRLGWPSRALQHPRLLRLALLPFPDKLFNGGSVSLGKSRPWLASLNASTVSLLINASPRLLVG